MVYEAGGSARAVLPKVLEVTKAVWGSGSHDTSLRIKEIPFVAFFLPGIVQKGY